MQEHTKVSLRVAREKAELGQRELARKTEISVATINRIENETYCRTHVVTKLHAYTILEKINERLEKLGKVERYTVNDIAWKVGYRDNFSEHQQRYHDALREYEYDKKHNPNKIARRKKYNKGNNT